MVNSLVEAAETVLATAERPGSRVEYAIGPNGNETWHDYQEVPQQALDALFDALVKVRTGVTQ